MDTLIINAQLANPPTEILAFRVLTLLSHNRFNLSNLIEVEENFKDIYYHFLKEKGAMDFIDYLITPREREEGIRIDVETTYPFTIQTDRILFSQVQNFIGQIGFLLNL